MSNRCCSFSKYVKSINEFIRKFVDAVLCLMPNSYTKFKIHSNTCILYRCIVYSPYTPDCVSMFSCYTSQKPILMHKQQINKFAVRAQQTFPKIIRTVFRNALKSAIPPSFQFITRYFFFAADRDH